MNFALGRYRTRDGTVVEIEEILNNGLVLRSFDPKSSNSTSIHYNLWDATTGNHINNPNLDLVSFIRTEENYNYERNKNVKNETESC